MDVRYKVRGNEKTQAYLKTVPRGTIRTALDAIAEYIIGDARHGLSHDDPYRQTTREAVYGKTFESDAQRRYVMAAIKDGRIKIGERNPDPTEASENWYHEPTNNGYGQTIKNDSPGAYWSREWGGWKNWRSVDKVVQSNIAGALRHAGAEVKKWLRSNTK